MRALLPFFITLLIATWSATAAEPPDAATVIKLAASARNQLRDVAIGPTRQGLDAALVVWQPSAGSDLKIVQVKNGESVTDGYEVELIRHDGDSTQYAVLAPTGAVVLAIKANYRCAERPRRFCPAVHTPYSPELETPELVEIGRTYLDGVIDAAAANLEMTGVKSIWLKDATLSEAIPAAALTAVIAVEHASISELEIEGIERVINRFLVTLALNGQGAYRHSVSRAGAVGLAQFIRGTYAYISRSYPTAKLNRDFLAGMSDHVNAVKAQYCLADWSLSRLPPDELRELTRPGREMELGAYVAAAYNGGENRAIQARKRHPTSWEQLGHGLKRETVIYVRMFRAVYRYLFSPETSRAVEIDFE